MKYYIANAEVARADPKRSVRRRENQGPRPIGRIDRNGGARACDLFFP